MTSKAQLAEGEEILVKCNSLCEGNGPVLSQLYDASGTPEQCTFDCAAAYGELFAVSSKTKADTKLNQKQARDPGPSPNPNPHPHPYLHLHPTPYPSPSPYPCPYP